MHRKSHVHLASDFLGGKWINGKRICAGKTAKALWRNYSEVKDNHGLKRSPPLIWGPKKEASCWGSNIISIRSHRVFGTFESLLEGLGGGFTMALVRGWSPRESHWVLGEALKVSPISNKDGKYLRLYTPWNIRCIHPKSHTLSRSSLVQSIIIDIYLLKRSKYTIWRDFLQCGLPFEKPDISLPIFYHPIGKF